MTARLAEPTLRLTALAGWVQPHRYHAGRDPWPLHWATLSPATDDIQGTAACGTLLRRDDQWWTASRPALARAASSDDVWQLCGPCLYWAGGIL